ncbi:MAG: class I SAM-dependent methyltransferase [Nitrososphaerales archaeon]|nr:class I SAM-dependent methyltransferase [Nitrososphaerales archaeon]
MQRSLRLAFSDPWRVAVRVIAGRRGLAWLYKRRNLLADPSGIDRDRLAQTVGVTPKRINDLILELSGSGLFEHFYNHAKEHAFVDSYWCAMEGAPALYAITRVLQPTTVVETGTWWGLSSACVLQAMKANGRGRLISIDIDSGSGGAIPRELRDAWQLVVGPSSQRLPALLESLRRVDMFIHDSEHSYENMMREFTTAWPFIMDSGLLVSDDVNLNSAFDEFASKVGRQPFIIYKRSMRGSQRQMGLVKK